MSFLTLLGCVPQVKDKTLTVDEKDVLLYKQLRGTRAQLQDAMTLSRKRKALEDGM